MLKAALKLAVCVLFVFSLTVLLFGATFGAVLFVILIMG